MGKTIIINTSKISIEQESKLEEFLENNSLEYKEDDFNGRFEHVTTQEDEDC